MGGRRTAARPEAARPEAARPEAARPEAARPGAARPGAARPEAPRQRLHGRAGRGCVVGYGLRVGGGCRTSGFRSRFTRRVGVVWWLSQLLSRPLSYGRSTPVTLVGSGETREQGADMDFDVTV